MIKGRAKYKSIQLSIKNYDKIVKKQNKSNLITLPICFKAWAPAL